MGHLKNTRPGWENERLAEFLLSRISFIANPAKTSDDLGTDFICTLFREETKNGVVQLFPTSSFAIQSKTGEPGKLDVSKHLDYLMGLELPFFVGFVDQQELALRIYSCHHLPALLSGVGNRLKELTLIPANLLNRDDIYHDLQAATSQPDRPAHLRIVYVATLAANETLEDRKTATTKIANQCSKTLSDIAAKISGEYYFTLDDEVYWVAAGVGSVGKYRYNLAKRLLEAFSNLSWMLQNGVGKDLVASEFSIYERLFVDLLEHGVKEVGLVENAYRRVADQLGR
jgi:hypothetical protein